MSEQAQAPSAGAMTLVPLDPAALAELRRAITVLETSGGVVIRLADLLGDLTGRGVRMGVRRLGMAPSLQASFQGIVEAALRRAFDVAILGLSPVPTDRRRLAVARPAVMLSGAIGGFVGFAGLMPDITLTTMAILREIARIAQEEGEDLADLDTKRACLQTFALRAEHATPTGTELGYFSTRLTMQGRPLVLLFNEVAASYGLAMSQKVAAQAVPVVGALAGATLNRAFLVHYQDSARAHFTIRRLERRFGQDTIRTAAKLIQAGGSDFHGTLGAA